MRLKSVLILTVMLAVFPLAAKQATTAPGPTKPTIERLEIAGETFKLELATDETARAKGLMGRKKIDDDSGMLFVYPKTEVLTFWMANCVIDIDVIFLDAEGKIVATRQMKAEAPKGDNESQSEYEARLKRYSSTRSAQFAIELKAGSIKRLELRRGMTIAMELEWLKKLAR